MPTNSCFKRGYKACFKPSYKVFKSQPHQKTSIFVSALKIKPIIKVPFSFYSRPRKPIIKFFPPLFCAKSEAKCRGSRAFWGIFLYFWTELRNEQNKWNLFTYWKIQALILNFLKYIRIFFELCIFSQLNAWRANDTALVNQALLEARHVVAYRRHLFC